MRLRWCAFRPHPCSPNGAALAICLSGGYEDDDDHGDWCGFAADVLGMVPPAPSCAVCRQPCSPLRWARATSAALVAHKCALPHSTCATCRFWYTGEGGRNDKTNTQVRSTVDKLHCWACACDAASAALVPPWCRPVLPFRPCWLPTPHHKNPLPLANPQVKDQAWVRGNAALRNAQLHGTPVRVVRAAARNGDPKQGFEYT